MVCYGIKENDTRELMDFHMTQKGESEKAWEDSLNRLYHRVLEGNLLEAVSIDGNKGLYNAIRFIYPETKIQRCWVHKLRNVANKCPRKIQEEVMKDARAMYEQEDRNKAIQAYKRWQEKWVHRNLQTTMIYINITAKNILGVRSPLDG